jgi:chitin disaccharide deacetylase
MHNHKLLIVNADDCALHPAVNQAVIQAHQEGILTSCSILAGAAAFDDAVIRLKAVPSLGVGVHLCLVDQSPVLPPSDIPSLVDRTGRLPRSYSKFILKSCLMRMKPDEIRRELFAQVAKVVDSGLKITHLDGHQHLHILPGIVPIVADIGRAFGIRCIRVPKENLTIKAAQPSCTRNLQRLWLNSISTKALDSFAREGLISTDHFFGFSYGGNLNEKIWNELIPILPFGSTEVMSHPGIDNAILSKATGWNYHWADEFRALCRPELKASLNAHGIRLINYGELTTI